MAEVKASIYESELSIIARFVLDFESLETGGDLFGHWSKAGMPIIKYATGPGKNTSRTSMSFFQDIPYLHECGDFLYNNFALEHIGSWHSHHKLGLDHPSGGDFNTMRNCLTTQGIDKFFIIICNIDGFDEVKINGFLFSNAFQNINKQTAWVVLPRVSPYRKQIEDDARFIVYPRTKKAKFKVNETTLDESKKAIPSEKVELPFDSYFNTEEGRRFLKKELEKIKYRNDCTHVELIQNEDKTIGIAFNFKGKEIEIRYPIDFSEKNPNPIIIEKDEEKVIKQHVFEAEPVRMYFVSPFNLLNEIKRRIFGIQTDDLNDESKSNITNIPID